MCCTPLCVNKHKEGKQDLSPPTICVVHHLLCVNKHKEGKQDLSLLQYVLYTTYYV